MLPFAPHATDPQNDPDFDSHVWSRAYSDALDLDFKRTPTQPTQSLNHATHNPLMFQRALDYRNRIRAEQIFSPWAEHLEGYLKSYTSDEWAKSDDSDGVMVAECTDDGLTHCKYFPFHDNFLDGSWHEESKSTQLRLVVAEDLSPRAILCLGSALNIEPSVFSDHLAAHEGRLFRGEEGPGKSTTLGLPPSMLRVPHVSNSEPNETLCFALPFSFTAKCPKKDQLQWPARTGFLRAQVPLADLDIFQSEQQSESYRMMTLHKCKIPSGFETCETTMLLHPKVDRTYLYELRLTTCIPNIKAELFTYICRQ